MTLTRSKLPKGGGGGLRLRLRLVAAADADCKEERVKLSHMQEDIIGLGSLLLLLFEKHSPKFMEQYWICELADLEKGIHVESHGFTLNRGNHTQKVLPFSNGRSTFHGTHTGRNHHRHGSADGRREDRRGMPEGKEDGQGQGGKVLRWAHFLHQAAAPPQGRGVCSRPAGPS